MTVHFGKRNVLVVDLDDPIEDQVECDECTPEQACGEHDYQPRIVLQHLHVAGSTTIHLSLEQATELALMCDAAIGRYLRRRTVLRD